jgi:23S rRNA (adenine-N6)-dimethyltransferase
VRAADVGAADLVVELGAGDGRLTAALAERRCAMRAVELDPALAAGLRGRFRASPHVTVVEGDALAVPLPEEPFRVVGNLPFHVTTAVLRRLLDDPGVPLERADVIVEWDVACKRARCWPGSLLNVLWGSRYELAVVRRLPAACFEPRPSVDAGVLRIVRRAEPLVAVAEYRRFAAFARAGFRDRNAGLARALSGWIAPLPLKRLGRELGFQPAVRARDLDVHQWAALFRAAEEVSRRPRGHTGGSVRRTR